MQPTQVKPSQETHDSVQKNPEQFSSKDIFHLEVTRGAESVLNRQQRSETLVYMRRTLLSTGHNK